MKIELKRHRFRSVFLLLLLGTWLQGWAQSATIVTGTVRDQTGAVMPNVTVTAINESDSTLQTSTVTNEKGVFGFTQLVTGATYRFKATYIGYQAQAIDNYKVKAADNVPVAIELSSTSNAALEEVIVVGYGTQKRENATGAVDQISSKSLENRPVTNLTQGLQGMLPNLNLKMMDGKPTQSPSYNIRVLPLSARAAVHWY
ncbi:carboxypeptidase-like regulatory domain-containing protein [Niabella sp. W65]|nr:carboxypeptidase-like regulatory domain-containing protein [Niabella sp. W65]MCH7365324.1 carboxypeptidase-like regulatory domain-containing protein [Niabella sp. W65]ULT41121.1 carboxypeptidase-like regulatory domain-containing protein [Niabella sp. I65]